MVLIRAGSQTMQGPSTTNVFDSSARVVPLKPSLLQHGSFPLSVHDVPILGWLAHGGPRHPKHRGWVHPVAVCLVHYTLVFHLSIQAHDWMVDAYYSTGGRESPQCQVDDRLQTQRTWAAIWLVVYAMFILVWRIWFRVKPIRPAGTAYWPVLYDYCFLCNVTMWQGAWALYTQRPILASALCVTVGIDQLLWYVDLVGFAAIGKFPVGVANYLLWPENAK